jgi:hypothetical protein
MEEQSLNNDIKSNICHQIDKWLESNSEYNNKSFGAKLGVSGTSIKRWRDCICIPDISLLPKICEIMDISIYQLLGISSNSSGLTKSETQLLDKYRNDNDFKNFIDRYLNDNEFKNLINSIVKISK